MSLSLFLFGITIAVASEAAGSEPPPRRVSTVSIDKSSGRLVRRIVVQPRVIAPHVVKETVPRSDPTVFSLAKDANLNAIIEQAASKHNVDPLLIHSVIQVESGYNPYARSPKGAQGLMQLIPSTAQRLGVKNVWDPKENIEAGVRYLKMLQQQFQDDRLALAAYNAGEAAVARWGWIPPYAETQNYVYQVGKRYGDAKRARGRAATQPTSAGGPRPVEYFTDAEGRLHLRNR